MGVTGLELDRGNRFETSGFGDTAGCSAAESGAVVADSPTSDPDLARVVEAWADLPESLRAGIVAMVGAAGPKR